MTAWWAASSISTVSTSQSAVLAFCRDWIVRQKPRLLRRSHAPACNAA